MIRWINEWYHPAAAADTTVKTRNYYLDNLKFILITFVVISHFALQLSYINDIKYLIHFIYLFHMPCFIFVNGFLAKRLNAGGKLRVDKIMVVFLMYFIFKFGNVLLEILFGRKAHLSLFQDSNAPWYLLALCVWYLSVPLLERIKTGYLLAGSLCIGMLVGYVSCIDNVFTLSRIFVFFPFFIMGFCLPGKKLETFLDKKIRIPAIIILVAIFLVIALFWKELSPVKNIVYGSSPYAISLKGLAKYGFFIRGIWYLVSIVVSISVMLLVPRCKLFFSALGERTMQVYMTHIWVRNALAYAGFFALVKEGSKLLAVGVLIGSVLLTFLLANKWLKLLFDLLMSPKLFARALKKE
jgi:fucose 4-O-acetylase-like acetyltransferase